MHLSCRHDCWESQEREEDRYPRYRSHDSDHGNSDSGWLAETKFPVEQPALASLDRNSKLRNSASWIRGQFPQSRQRFCRIGKGALFSSGSRFALVAGPLRDWRSALRHPAGPFDSMDAAYGVFKRAPQTLENYLLCLQSLGCHWEVTIFHVNVWRSKKVCAVRIGNACG